MISAVDFQNNFDDHVIDHFNRSYSAIEEIMRSDKVVKCLCVVFHQLYLYLLLPNWFDIVTL